MLRLEGTIVGEPGTLVFADATLTVGKKKTVERAAPQASFVLRTDDGLEVRVEGVERARKAGKLELSGPYRELAAHPVAVLFSRVAPGDHVRASVRGFGLFGGDRVTIEGEVIEEAVAPSDGTSTSDGGLREAPRRVPSVVRASVLRIGGAEAEPEEREGTGSAGQTEPFRPDLRARRPLETSTYVYLAIGAPLLAASLVLGWLAPIVPARAWLTPMLGIGLATFAVGAHRWLRTRHHASYVTIVGGARLTAHEPFRGYGADPWMLGVAYAPLALLTAVEPSPSAAILLTAAPLLFSLVHLIMLLVREHPFRRFASLVLRAPRGELTPGRMTLLEGTVAPSGTIMRRRVEFLPKSEVSYTTDAAGNSVERLTSTLRDREHTSAERFAVRAAGTGRPIEVDPRSAHVAFAKRAWQPHASIAVYEETLAEGAPVCVLGRFERDGEATRASAGGEESLFVWAGSRAELARALLLARSQLAILAGLTALPLLLALHAFPFAARYRAEGTVVASTSPAIPMGATCTVSVLAYHYGEEPRCSVELTCAGRPLYGGYGMGQMDCAPPTWPFDTTLSGADGDAYDGDPALAFSLVERTLHVTSDTESATLALEDVRPSLWR